MRTISEAILGRGPNNIVMRCSICKEEFLDDTHFLNSYRCPNGCGKNLSWDMPTWDTPKMEPMTHNNQIVKDTPFEEGEVYTPGQPVEVIPGEMPIEEILKENSVRGGRRMII